MKQAEDDRVDVPLCWSQGGYRIVYTSCDEDLMGTVLNGLKDSIAKIIELDKSLTGNHESKREARKAPPPIHKFLQPLKLRRID